MKITLLWAILLKTADDYTRRGHLVSDSKGKLMRAPTTTIELDPQTDSTIRMLMGPLHETSKEGVVRKAVALMKQVVDMSQDQRFFILETPKGEKTRIWLD